MEYQLSTTREKSFQLNSSYDNINKISNNKYIKDINLQTKIKQILLDETKNGFIKRRSFLKLPSKLENIINISQTPKASKNYKEFQSMFSSKECENIHSKKSNNILNKKVNKTMRYNSDDSSLNDINTKNKSKNNIDSNKLDIPKKENFASTRSIYNLKINRTPNLEARKIKKKLNKQNPEINKQLNIISKNIKNTSKNINNPEEFYMNLFSSILEKESIRNNSGIESNKNSNKSNPYSNNKLNENYLSEKDIEKKLSDSFFSNKESNNKDSNANLIKVKSKQKSNLKIS